MNIVVYGRTKPPCVQCDYTKVWLDRLELKYEFIDVSADKAAQRDAEKIIRTENLNLTWPLVIVSNSHRAQKWSGFKIEKLKSLRETGNY